MRRQEEHKIQSQSGALALHLTRVPKALGIIRRYWLPEAMITSFKLETDESILLEKAQKSIDMYGVDIIVANLLSTRQQTVYLVKGQAADQLVERIDKSPEVAAIEITLVNKLSYLHNTFINM